MKIVRLHFHLVDTLGALVDCVALATCHTSWPTAQRYVPSTVTGFLAELTDLWPLRLEG